jgi:undecaprenyl diphosphate synthase
VQLDPDHIPRHIAIIMDGNGRWANRQGLPRRAGHTAGETALFDTVEGALEIGVEALTVYAFSTENWKRPASEVAFLMSFNESLLLRRKDELNDRGVRVRFSGRRGRPVPKRLVRMIEETETLTAANTRMTMVVAFNYGGHAEIVDAAARAAEDMAAGKLKKVTEKALAARLYEPDLPDVDLLIRTSGEHRTSNFLLWQAAYAELVFTDVLWPDFDRHTLRECVAEYQRRDRRFGGAEDAPAEDTPAED